MKKIFIYLICFSSFFLFSCASNNVEANAPLEEITEIPNEEEQKEEIIEEPLFPIPEVLTEPEITTLEPAEEPEIVVEIEEEKDEALEPELIIVEEPEPIIQVEEQKTIPQIENNADDKSQDEQESQINKKDIVSDNINIDSKETVQKDSNLTNEDTEHPEVTQEEENSKIEEVRTEVPEDNTEEQEIEETTETITPSRSVTLKLKEYVDITYPGSGWIYMGATDGSKNLTYFGRGLGSKDTTFSLQARYPGTKILHFYKNDHLTNEYLDDYIEIVILDETGSNKTHIAAPEYKQPVPKKAKEMFYEQKVTITDEDEVIVISEEEDEEEKVLDQQIKKAPVKKADARGAETQKETTVSDLKEKTEITDPNTLLKEAQLLYNEKEFKLADEKINDFLKNATKNIDEGLFLKGQILEGKSEIQNIKNAIAAYETLIKEFPASKYWDAAKKRIIYLKRFYLEVR